MYPPFDLSIGQNGSLGFEGDTGAGWVNLFTNGDQAKVGGWFHVAWVYDAKDSATFYVNGREAGSSKMDRPLASNDQPLIIGRSPCAAPSWQIWTRSASTRLH